MHLNSINEKISNVVYKLELIAIFSVIIIVVIFIMYTYFYGFDKFVTFLFIFLLLTIAILGIIFVESCFIFVEMISKIYDLFLKIKNNPQIQKLINEFKIVKDVLNISHDEK